MNPVPIGPNQQNGTTGGSYQQVLAVTSAGTLNAANLPGHTHPATFTAITSSTPVTVSAPAQSIPVTIPVGASAQSAAPANPLTGSVTLTNSVINGTQAGSFRGPFSPGPLAASTVNVTGGTASGNPGGSFTGNVTTVTGGTVAVQSNASGNPAAFQVVGHPPKSRCRPIWRSPSLSARKGCIQPNSEETCPMTDATQHAVARIGSLCAADFRALVGGPLSVQIVTDPDAGAGFGDTGAGEMLGGLGGAILIAAEERPRTTMPGSPRKAFSLRLKVPDPGAFAVGHALIDVPGKGPLGPVYLERTLPPPGDLTAAYFNINFS